MASTIQVDKIQDTGGNTILSSNSTGTFTPMTGGVSYGLISRHSMGQQSRTPERWRNEAAGEELEKLLNPSTLIQPMPGGDFCKPGQIQ